MVKGRDITFFQIVNEVSRILYWILHSFLNDWLCTWCSSLPNGLPLAPSSNSTTPPTFSWGTFSLPTILCDSGEVAQHSQLEFWIGAAMDDPVSAASHGHDPGMGMWPQHLTWYPSLGLYVLTLRKVILFFDLKL